LHDFTAATCRIDWRVPCLGSTRPSVRSLSCSPLPHVSSSCVLLSSPLPRLGEDLTLFPSVWDEKNGSARCLALKPLKELYEAMSGFLLFRYDLMRTQLASLPCLNSVCAFVDLMSHSACCDLRVFVRLQSDDDQAVAGRGQRVPGADGAHHNVADQAAKVSNQSTDLAPRAAFSAPLSSSDLTSS
jgi:hypothetical protein